MHGARGWTRQSQSTVCSYCTTQRRHQKSQDICIKAAAEENCWHLPAGRWSRLHLQPRTVAGPGCRGCACAEHQSRTGGVRPLPLQPRRCPDKEVGEGKGERGPQDATGNAKPEIKCARKEEKPLYINLSCSQAHNREGKLPPSVKC